MDPSEIEFLSESLPVSIVPNFNEGVMYLLSGEVGPFKAGMPVTVPLWLAVNLRGRSKCRYWYMYLDRSLKRRPCSNLLI